MENITRRTAVSALALGAAGLALSGCSAKKQEEQPKDPRENFDYTTNYLPMGSVVRLKTTPPTISSMVISRKPYASAIPSDNEEGEVVPDHVYDYLGVYFPFGIVTDLAKSRADTGEMFFFDTEDIDQVLFVGYIDEIETEAEQELSAAEENDTALKALTPLLNATAESFKDGN